MNAVTLSQCLAASLPRYLVVTLSFCALLALAACSSPPAPAADTYDLVIANGRVMDPESKLDAVRHVGIRAGRIEALSATPLQGTKVVDATNHVVAPGFIDLHVTPWPTFWPTSLICENRPFSAMNLSRSSAPGKVF